MQTVRGRIQRDTSQGDGIVFLEGRQVPFKLEEVWRSEMAPAVNMLVEADLDDAGNLVALRAVGAQTVAAENAAKMLDAAQGTAKELAGNFQAKGMPILMAFAARVGYPVLASWALIVIAWFFLAAFVIKAGFMGDMRLTFYQGLTLMNAAGQGMAGLMTGGGGAGIWGLLAWVSLALVFLPQVWTDKRAHYGLAAPLLMMVLAVLVVYFKMRPDTSEAAEMAGNDPQMRAMVEKMAAEASKAAREAFSFGWGAYLGVIAAVYLAWRGVTAARRP